MLIQIITSIVPMLLSFVAVRLLEYFIRERREQRKIAEEMRKAYMLALKCVITNKELSRQARLDAYDEYRKLGGNSWVETYVIQRLKHVED